MKKAPVLGDWGLFWGLLGFFCTESITLSRALVARSLASQIPDLCHVYFDKFHEDHQEISTNYMTCFKFS